MVKKEYQGTGVYRTLNLYRLEQSIQEKTELIYTRTQNPRMEAGIVSTFEKLKSSGTIRGYFLERKKQENAYGRMLTETKPDIPKNSPYEALDYEAGDAFVLLFRVVY